jgi:hypothetical protein
MKLSARLSILAFLGISTHAWSGPNQYECTISEDLVLTSEGLLDSSEQIYLGGVFHVERATGVVLGGGLGNSTYPIKQIIDPGGTDQSFKLLWISAPVASTEAGRNSVYLSIREYEDKFLKPFLAVASSHVVSGVCK